MASITIKGDVDWHIEDDQYSSRKEEANQLASVKIENKGILFF